MAIRSVTLSDTIGELVTEFNLMGTDIGDLSLLTTTDTSSIVAAIASLDSDLRADFGVALDSAGIIDLITDPTSLFSIFDSADFEINDGVISIRDSDTTFTSLNTTILNATTITSTNIDADSGTITTISFTNAYGGNIDADSAYFTGVVNAQDFNSTSDESLKENIETLNNAIDIVNRIRPVSFTWKKNNQTAYGVIAQEVEEVLPAIVDEDKDHIKRVAYSQLIPFLIQVIQQQDLEIQKIKKTLNLD